MKTFLKILGSIVVLLLLIIGGLHLYFNSQRLKSMILPKVDQALGREVQVKDLSFSVLRSFPNIGLVVDHMVIPDDNKDTLASFDQLVVGVKLLPLLSKNISISNITLVKPHFIYTIYKNGSTNLDELQKQFKSEPKQASQGSTTSLPVINVKDFRIENANIGYFNFKDTTTVWVFNLNTDISLHYADLIHSTVDMSIGGLSVTKGGNKYLSSLPLNMTQESTVDMNNEVLDLKKGQLSIRGLALDVTGQIKKWSADSPNVDLSFQSSSDNFGALLKLVPDAYQEKIKGLETKGALTLNGNIKGVVGGDKIPAFQMKMIVKNGYVKNPQLPEPIQNIAIDLSANNKVVQLKELKAQAGSNTLDASGKLSNPLKDNGKFNLDITADADLGTVNRFYSLKDLGVESLKGKMHLKAEADGHRDKPEKAAFTADMTVKNGFMKYKQAQKPFENINVFLQANQNRVHIQKFTADAAGNSLTLNGVITQPMNEKSRGFDINANVKADLATIKDFYPIDPDTLDMKGDLTANVNIKGKANDLKNTRGTGQISLANGYIKTSRFGGQKIEGITLQSNISDNRILIKRASLRSGSNTLKASGTVSNYLAKSPDINLSINSNVRLNEVGNYYDIKKYVKKLNGTANANLTVKGPVKDTQALKFDGGLVLKNVNVESDSLPRPIKNLNVKLNFSQSSVDLGNMSMLLGDSDFKIDGSLKNYMAMVVKKSKRKNPATLTGSYNSHFLDVDQLMNWSSNQESDTSAVPVNLPYLNSSVHANIDSMIVLGVKMTKMQVTARTTPEMVEMTKGAVHLFGGDVDGSFSWMVPDPNNTHIQFKGKMDSLRAEKFFKEYPVFGKKNKFYKYITGKFSANTTYETDLNKYLDPVIKSTKAKGSFGTKHLRLKNNPVQVSLAQLLNEPQLKDVVLDDWKADYTIDNGILTLKNFKLYSKDTGLSLHGTQNLITDKIDYNLTVYLPARYGPKLAKVVGKQVVMALTQDDKSLAVPVAVKGTSDHPKVGINKDVVKKLLDDYLKNAVKNKLKSLFNGGH